MHHYRTILFDLDGTLTDPLVGITSSVAYALKSFGIETSDPNTLSPFIGPPLKESFQKFYGMNDDESDRAVAKYREYFSVTGIFENKVYPGIPNLLASLKAQGRTVVLATSKPTVYARQILEHFGLIRYFDFTAGSELDGTRVKKGEVIAYALEQIKADRKENILMVGDRCHDIIGARENGLASAGVLFGYGSRTELTQAGANYIINDVEELTRLLLPEASP